MITFSGLSVAERRACLEHLDYLSIFHMPAHPRTGRDHRMARAYARLKDYCCGVGDDTVPRDRQQRREWDDEWIGFPLQGSFNHGFPLYLGKELVNDD